ncbi:hypothetical protein ACFYOV_28515 [Streptomyces sp. NPDC005931]|uniref:hypothetical protein n=1 Tax=Streptomyces sp. NPDC005931 TaxID=3364737 RepID=UPI0036A4AF54
MSNGTESQEAVVAIPDLGLSDSELNTLKSKFENDIMESMRAREAGAEVEVKVSVSVKI